MIGNYILVAFIAFIVGAMIGGCFFDAFKIGAEWMQKKMIEKATQWLMENAKKYIVDVGIGQWEREFIVGGKCWEDFRKAMED